MKKNNNKKIITVVISAMLVSIMAIGMLAGCSSKPTPPDDVSSNVSSEVNSTVSEPVSSAESVEPSSEVVSEVSSEVSSVASVEPVESKVTSNEPVKETTKPVSSQPIKEVAKPAEIPKPKPDPSKPKDGDEKIGQNEKGENRYLIYNSDTGVWEDYGPADQKVVDDSDKVYPPCDSCGQPSGHCVCIVGY